MKRVLTALAALIVSASGSAYVLSGSNLSMSRYPEFDEMTPSKPYDRDEYSAQK